MEVEISANGIEISVSLSIEFRSTFEGKHFSCQFQNSVPNENENAFSSISPNLQQIIELIIDVKHYLDARSYRNHNHVYPLIR